MASPCVPIATVTLAKPSSIYSTDIRYCPKGEKNAQSALICLFRRDVWQMWTTVGTRIGDILNK
jgi:hypothetical protein